MRGSDPSRSSCRGVYTPPKLSNSLSQKHFDGKTPGMRFHIGCTAHFRTLFTESWGGLVATVMLADVSRVTSYRQDTITHKERSGVVNKWQWMERLDRIPLNGTQKVYSSTQRGCWVSRRVQLSQRAVAQNEKSLWPIPGLQVPTIRYTLRRLGTTSR